MPDNNKKGWQAGNKPISKAQIKIIHVALGELKISDEEYRTILSDRYWVNTCKALSYDDAHDLIFNYFVEKGFRVVTKKYQSVKVSKPRAQNIIQMVSPQQLAKIEHLRADIRWHVHDGFQRWLKKWLKKEKIQTGKDAFRVIEGLKGMLSRQEKACKPASQPADQLRHDGNMQGGYYKW